MEYKAVIKSDPSKELTHWKYIKREKVNGKWRYYYDKDAVKKDVNYVKQEASRSAQNVKYDVADTALKYRQNTADNVGEYLGSTVKRGYNAVLKSLNNIGKGTLDDSLDSLVQTASKKINELFNKLTGKKNKKNKILDKHEIDTKKFVKTKMVTAQGKVSDYYNKAVPTTTVSEQGTKKVQRNLNHNKVSSRMPS